MTKNTPTVKIIVATHKKYEMPQDAMYLPLHVGAEGKTDQNGNPLDLGYQKDNTGENISNKNAAYCELTGLYWAWKNLDTDYTGLAHYRRHFGKKIELFLYVTRMSILIILVVNEGTATIDYVPSRNNSRVAKAPQSFWLDDILKAHEKALSEGEKNCIDSCTMMQRYGYDLYLIDGPGENIKITTPEDFYTMRAILEAKENEQIYGLEYRHGMVI